MFPDMPDFDEKDKANLVDHFFAEINPLFALLHESVFREQLRLFLQLNSQPLPKTNRAALFLTILALVYALSIRFTEFMKVKGPNMENLTTEDRLFKYAFRMLLIFSVEWESFEIVQGWQLATLCLRISHKQSSFSNTLSQAINMVKLMGLGRFVAKSSDHHTYEILKA